MSNQATAVNNAGGQAYALSAKQALAQFAATGCFNDTFYASAESQLDNVLKLCKQVEPRFIAKLAIFTRENSFMKDMPAFLLAYLTTVDTDLVADIFNRIIDNGKMLKTFVQIMRSGAVGRKSLGYKPRNLVREWLVNRGNNNLFWDSVGNNPSIGDVIRLSHPKPKDEIQSAFFAYLAGFKYDKRKLPESVQEYELWKEGKSETIPNVDMRLLTCKKLSTWEWTEIAKNASWQTIRMNLETFSRHGVLADDKIVKLLAEKLADAKQVERAKCFPYQLLTTYKEVDKSGAMPRAITNALQDAMEHATRNITDFGDKSGVVCVDTSRSMLSAITGKRLGATSATTCLDVAALVAACILRKNKNADVIPFNGAVVDVRLNPRDSVMTNASVLAKIGGGSTYCPAPLKLLNQKKAKLDYVIYVSDNESWVNGAGGFGERRRKGTELHEEWKQFKRTNPSARMVCLDVTPGETCQALDDRSILNVGGFSDNVFAVISAFLQGSNEHWVDYIEKVKI